MKYIDLFEICRPKQWKTISQKNLNTEGYPVYGANGIIGYYKEYNHVEPTVMITCRGATCGTVNISDPKSYITGNAMCLDDLSSEFDKKYLFYFLTKRGFDDVISGSAQPQITRTGLKKVKVPFVPFKIQQQIVEILDEADAVRKKREKTIEKLSELKNAIYYEMFGDPIKNSKNIKTRLIRDIATVVRGSSPRPKGDPAYYNGPVPRLMVEDLTRDGLYVHAEVDSLTKEGAKKSRPMKKNEVVIVVSGNVGITAILQEDCCIHDGFVGLRDLNHNVLPEYLAITLNNMTETHEKRKAGAIFKNLTTTQIKNMEVPLPSLEAQGKFTERLNIVKDTSDNIINSQERMSDLFNQLLKKSFKGEFKFS